MNVGASAPSARRAPSAQARRRRPPGLGTRLFLAQFLVVLVGGATVLLLVTVVGPPLFRRHLRQAATEVDAATSQHVEEAFRSATALSTTVAMAAALVAALLVSVFATRRVVRRVDSLAQAAEQVAAGRYDVRVTATGLGDEFGKLSAAFNVMAARLDAVEGTRRRLLADLAHEMRTPVAVLDAYLEGVQDGLARLDSETVAALRNQTARLGRLAEDISAVSRAEEGLLDLQIERLDPAELVRTAVAAAADRFTAKGVTLLDTTSHELPHILADRDRVGQVLGNLLDNALRHTPASGSVAVEAKPGEPGFVTLTVTDTGEGIRAEHLPHVFERFYRVDRSRDRAHGGSGIGLTIAKAVTEAQGGRIAVTSHGAGAGSTFTVQLPMATAPAGG
ncbi:sensor histidine kinase [Kribbella sp. NPDC050124]|uniref:sensor histidine kinase n=1 Tax=Kribbella sp. NPDC050124 TaxID=3364114 RepID=UPI0037B253A8